MKQEFVVGDKVRFKVPNKKGFKLIGTIIDVSSYNAVIQTGNGIRWLDIPYKECKKIISVSSKEKTVSEFLIFLREKLLFNKYSAFLSTRCTECNSYYVGGIIDLGEGTIEELRKKAEALKVYLNGNCKHEFQVCKTTRYKNLPLRG